MGLTSATAQARLPIGIDRGVPSRSYGSGPGLGLGGIVPRLIPRGGEQDEDEPPSQCRPVFVDEPRPGRNSERRALKPVF